MSCQKLDKFASSYFCLEIVIVCAVLYFIHISLGVFVNDIFSVFIFICYIKFVLFYRFVLGFCPKYVIVYDGGGYLGTDLCRHSFCLFFFCFWSCCAFSCCLVAHCVAPSAEMLTSLCTGIFLYFICCCFLCFFPWGGSCV